MIPSNPLMGTFLHAIGGGAAACCYLPQERIKRWSYESFWIVQACFAWLIVPISVGLFTVPDLWSVYREAPIHAVVVPILLGALYGFGGMAFGFAIRHIGYSLTYTISIGISAIIGTIIPLLLTGTLVAQFTRPGGGVFFVGMMISLLGLILGGAAGYRKERDIAARADGSKSFNMSKGLFLTIFAGVLSGVFGVALFIAQPVAEIASAHGAGYFEANAAQILPSIGCLVTNLIWFIRVSVKQKSLKELVPSKSGLSGGRYCSNMLLSSCAGSLWYLQFLFLGMANVRMGEFEFAGWGIHMFMLIFFSFVIGLLMKEWRDVSRRTFLTLILALVVLLISFVVMTYGSMIGEGMV